MAILASSQITGSLFVSNSVSSGTVFTASIQQGYVWVGGANNISTLVATSSFKNEPYTGSLNVSGSVVLTGSIRQTAGTNVISDTVISGSTGLTLTGSMLVSGFQNFIGTNTLFGNTTITGSMVVSGSQTFIGTKTISGSVFITGSKNVIGNVTITGSILQTAGTNIVSDTVISGSSGLTITGSIKQTGQTVITGSLIVSGSGGGGVFSKNAYYISSSTLPAYSQSIKVWRAPFPASVVSVYGIRQGGTTAQVNAFRSSSTGLAAHSGSNITLPTAEWTPITTLQNTSYAIGDTLVIHLSASATNTQVTCQVDFVRI
jgi:hypothetical protein